MDLTTGRAVPVIELDVSEMNVDVYDQVALRTDWTRLLGRLVQIRYVKDGSLVAEFRQRFETTAGLLRRHPSVISAVAEITEDFDANNRDIRLRITGDEDEAQKLRRYFPGELAKIILRFPKRRWTSELLVGIEQQNEGSRMQLNHVTVGPALIAMQEPLCTFIDSLEGTRARVHFFLVHNHPAVMAPLSPDDFASLHEIDRTFATHFDEVD